MQRTHARPAPLPTISSGRWAVRSADAARLTSAGSAAHAAGAPTRGIRMSSGCARDGAGEWRGAGICGYALEAGEETEGEAGEEAPAAARRTATTGRGRGAARRVSLSSRYAGPGCPERAAARHLDRQNGTCSRLVARGRERGRGKG